VRGNFRVFGMITALSLIRFKVVFLCVLACCSHVFYTLLPVLEFGELCCVWHGIAQGSAARTEREAAYHLWLC
jgi:hypothetical protein